MSRSPLALSLCLALAAAPLFAKTYDDGRFDPSWVGGGPEFREAEEVDYLWVRPGFSFEGKQVQFAPWEESVWLGEDADERDAKDKRLANDLSRGLPEIFAEAFKNALGGKVTVVDSGADLRAVGRIVDCSTGSAAAKFWVGMGAGSGSTTFDLKFVDSKSGEVMVALHHRVVSGTTLSTTDSKLVDWVDEFAESIGKKGIEALYQKGDRVRK
jgi:hypothetical protein